MSRKNVPRFLNHWKGVTRKRQHKIGKTSKRKYRTETAFELCLLLVTVLAAAELQYASYAYSLISPNLSPQQIAEQMQKNTQQVNGIFRWTTFPIFIILPLWILLTLLPSSTKKPSELKFPRRFLSELCWGLFGNLLVLEIITFSTLSIPQEIITSGTVGILASIFIFPLTTFANLLYVKTDLDYARFLKAKRDAKKNWRSRINFYWQFRVFPIIESSLIYSISYLIIYIILGASIILQTPNPPTI
jgi:hypothetical protein